VSFPEEGKQVFNNLNGTASLEAEDLAWDPAAQPSSGPELCSVPSRPKLGIPVRKTCLALGSDQEDHDCPREWNKLDASRE
jgi:hypothetical protein